MHICVPIPHPDSFPLWQGHGNLLAVHFLVSETTNILSFGLAYTTFELSKWKYNIKFCVFEFLRSHQCNMSISEFLRPHMRLYCLSQLHSVQLSPPDSDQSEQAWYSFHNHLSVQYPRPGDALYLGLVLGDRTKGRQRKCSLEYF